MEALRFPCTTGGRVSRSRRRLRRLLLGLAALMVGLAVTMVVYRGWGPAIVCLIGAGACWQGWRMSGDLDVFWLALAGETLTVQMRRQSDALVLRRASARRLDDEERRHVVDLASASGVIFASASFESSRLGTFDLYASDLDDPVLVEAQDPDPDATEPRRWVVTPDDVDDFLAAVAAVE